jgi:hypothetical protein
VLFDRIRHNREAIADAWQSLFRSS